MCDTMVALGNSTRDGKVLLAKNSDRQPNEPHIMVRIGRKSKPGSKKIKCTYIEVAESQETYEVLLLKPSWIWGCEMGCNEFGLSIGNEAVFTREKYGPPSLTGMDMIRLALERCRTCEEALDYIILLLNKYGQGGNCGYNKKFTYHNSFLIADPKSAWVLETSGEYWAAQKVNDVRSISNCLSIGKYFDRAHPRLIDHAVKKGWCKSEHDFDFATCYSDRIFTYFSGAKTRQQYSQSILENHRGEIDTALIRSILRSHHHTAEGNQLQQGSVNSICMHAGGLIGDHTTGSYIASLDDKCSTYWVTGSSTPCLSVFKPLWLIDCKQLPGEKESEKALAFWEKREILHHMLLQNQIAYPERYFKERDRLEKEWEDIAYETASRQPSKKELQEIMQAAWDREEDLITGIIAENEFNPPHLAGSLYFRYYWYQQIKKFKNNYSRRRAECRV